MLERDTRVGGEADHGIARRMFLSASGRAAFMIGAALGPPSVSNAQEGNPNDALARKPSHPQVQSNDGVVYEHSTSDVMRASREKFPLVPNDKRVTRENFMASVPNLRWVHRHGYDIPFHSMTIDRGDGPVRPLRYRPADPEKVERLTLTVEKGATISVRKWLAETHTDEIIVMHDGDIIFHKCYGEQTPVDLHWVWSMTKSFLALVAANVTDDNARLDEHAPVTRYVPEYAHTGYNGATFAQIMDMQAGIRYRYEPEEEDAKAGATQMGTPAFRRASFEDARHYRANGIIRKLENEPEDFGVYDFLFTLKEQDRPHGSVLYYSDISAPAATLILERVTGKPFTELASRHLWQNLGAENDARILHDGRGTALTNAGLFVTGRDLARLVQAILDNGRANSQRLFPASFVEEVMKGLNRDKFNEHSNLWGTMPPGLSYRNFTVALPGGARTMILGGGAFGQWFLADVERRNVVVKLSSNLLLTPDQNRMEILALQALSNELSSVSK